MTGSVPDRFAQWVRRTPDALALVGGDRPYTYAELDAWAEHIAARLAGAGVAAGDRVGVCMQRSPGLIASLLGILRAGAAYVPVDPADPPARLAMVLGDAAVSTVLVDEPAEQTVRAHAGTVTLVGDPPAGPRAAYPPVPVDAHDAAYLMYTSGSTGQPKAVVVEHHSIINLVTEPNYVTLGPEDRMLHLAPTAFDASTFEIWGTLLNGARLVLTPPDATLSETLDNLIREYGITVLWIPTALLHRQIDERPEAFRGPRTIITGGEVLSVGHVRRLLASQPDCPLLNAYGPTEATTFTTLHPVTPEDVTPGPVPIGRPIQNVEVHILDPAGSPVPDGSEGELCISGAGVGRGYWRRPELTARSFVRLPPIAGGALLYRSGDLARRRADGVLEFLGRIDGQFKIRGFRVEPGEVESALMTHPQVERAAVATRSTGRGETRLVAYVVPATGGPVDRRQLRAYLRERLPSYLIPAVFVVLPEIPVTPNGKTDRSALPMPDWTRRDTYV